MNRLPTYGFIGLAIMALSEALMFAHVEPFWSWHTPIAWTGYILFVDGVVAKRRKSSWLTSSKAELAFLAALSVPLWLIFEAYNQLIKNWYYINLPPNTFWRYFGYTWAFATIWPAIFETAELVAVLRGSPGRQPGQSASTGFPNHGSIHSTSSVGVRSTTVSRRPPRLSRGEWISVIGGAAMLLWPVVQPSPYLAAPVWLGFIFLLDPLNRLAGAETLLMGGSGYARVINLSISGLTCGFLWEFWNYWSRAKWIYTVPILPNLRIFEMPVAGYGGFPAFALECFTLYAAARWWLWRGPVRPIGL